MKKFILILLTILVLSGCSKDYEKHEVTIYEKFDTVIIFTAYTKTEKEFKNQAKFVDDEFGRLHKLFTTYDNFEGINNAKTINDMAGKKPVKVDKDLFDLIKFSKENYKKYNKKTNIAFGSVTDIWKKYRDNALKKKIIAIPTKQELETANKHTNIDNIILDEKNMTVFLKDKDSKLDLGASAKGYATEIIAKELEKRGLTSGIISAGGNVRTIGKPVVKGKDKWKIAIQNPNLREEKDKQYIATIDLGISSMVTSGDYQRFYIYKNNSYHHIIDPITLFPSKHFKSVTIVTKDSALADFLSTTVFLMDYDEGKKLIDSIKDVDAFWVMQDNTIKYSDNLKNKIELNN